MADYDSSTTVSAPPDALFAYLSDVSNLPEYFPQMSEAHSTGREEVHTEARTPGGQAVEGEAWFRVDEAAQHISWGSEGANDYYGSLDVTAVDGGTSRVAVHIHSPHTDDAQVQQSVEDTVATIRRTVELAGAGQG